MSPGRGNDPKTRRRDAPNARRGLMGWERIAEGEFEITGHITIQTSLETSTASW